MTVIWLIYSFIYMGQPHSVRIFTLPTMEACARVVQLRPDPSNNRENAAATKLMVMKHIYGNGKAKCMPMERIELN